MFYVRAVCLKSPFPAASTNLGKLLGRLAGLAEPEKDRAAKVTQHTFVPVFLRLHGLLHHAQRLRQAVRLGGLLCDSLTSLVVSEALSTWQLLQIITVNMWAWQLATPSQHGELSKEERLVGGVVAHCQAALLAAAILPVYTLKKGEQLLDYFALPAARLLLEWVRAQPAVLRERGFTSRPQLWPGLARLLNEVAPLQAGADTTELRDFPLPEDYDLQAFSPLQSALTRLDMRQVGRGTAPDPARLAVLRCVRLTELGHALTRTAPPLLRWDGQQFQAAEADWGDEREEPSELAEQLAALELGSDSSEESDAGPVPVWDESETVAGQQKPSGILKPAPGLGSPSPTSSASPICRPRPAPRNVAMAAILARAAAGQDETGGEGRKVMFRTPSPGSHSTGTTDSQQDDLPVPLLPPLPPLAPRPRRVWSPPPPAPARPKISVDSLDFSVPPPSLHSNVRPPALFSPPGLPAPAESQWPPVFPGRERPVPVEERLGPGMFAQGAEFSAWAGLPEPPAQSWPSPVPPSGGQQSQWPSLGQASQPSQSYSLFSPSGWPGPLLSSPQQPGQPGGFGTGPSPLERLLHQHKNDN